MRLYRFVKTDDKIDVVVATDGSCGQKRVFITESPRGVVVPGQTGATDDQKEGSDSFLVLFANGGVQSFNLVASAD